MSFLHTFEEENIQTPQEQQDRDKLFKQIKKIIERKYPEANLSLFGSSNNGFAMKNSDLDICMTLDGQINEKVIKLFFKEQAM